jgi:RNA polymerase sigma-70 factor, ECF subfamily
MPPDARPRRRPREVVRLTDAEFAALYERNARPLWVYVYRTTGNAADADDIVQESFVRTIDAALPATEEERRRYLFRVASNLATDRWRRANRDDTVVQFLRTDAIPTAPSPPDDDVGRTFAGLKPRDRALLWLAYVEGETHESIADALHVSRGSVKVLLSRARERLRGLLRARGLDRPEVK